MLCIHEGGIEGWFEREGMSSMRCSSLTMATLSGWQTSWFNPLIRHAWKWGVVFCICSSVSSLVCVCSYQHRPLSAPSRSRIQMVSWSTYCLEFNSTFSLEVAWPDDSGDILWDLTRDINFTAEVSSTQNSVCNLVLNNSYILIVCFCNPPGCWHSPWGQHTCSLTDSPDNRR